jgi:nitroimidazol reductase NimA-like FMN-containing flavoprotein (pyridoxamine 5'-phosphate oxidase superfamily)
MERKIRRSDRAISESTAREILAKGEYGILSTVSSDGQPYGVPVNYACTQEFIYFHCAIKGHKLDNLSGNNRVSFCVVGETEVLPDQFATKYESAIVFGQALEVFEEEKRQILLELIKKYSPEFIEKGRHYIESDERKTRVYKIAIEAITGKSRK